jgi:hypothetical protein
LLPALKAGIADQVRNDEINSIIVMPNRRPLAVPGHLDFVNARRFYQYGADRQG